MRIKNRYFKASITVESAFSFTITVFVIFLMLGPLLIVKTTSDFMVELNNISKTRCDYEMIKYANEETDLYKRITDFVNDNNIPESSIKNIENIANHSAFLLSFSNRYGENEREYRNVNSVYSMNVDIYDTEKNIVKYDYLVNFSLPYNLLHVGGVTNRLLNIRRAFVGSDGDRFDSEFESGEYVYVANNYMYSLVYHLSVNCTYLRKKTTRIEYRDVEQYRNDSNQKYSMCNHCFKNIELNDDTICYITQYGDRFHYKEDCPLITAYVTKIHKDSIETYNLRPCFKCGKDEE